jgi:endogenous inhibitor of DNA gyrase (YacG/DUF329 family)
MKSNDGDTLREPSATVNRKSPRDGVEVRELTGFAPGQYDRSAMAHVTCPTCRLPTPWDGNPHRPFCSLSCRLIDLGVWLDERYRIAIETETESESAADDDTSRVS